MGLLFLITAVSFAALAVVAFSYEWLSSKAKSRAMRERQHRMGIASIQETGGTGLKAVLKLTPLAAALGKREQQKQGAAFERELPACLEVVALGMQAGMGFDQAFALYTERFDTALARCCREPLAVWQKGLKSRDECLRELADKVGTASFRHFCSSVLRALRFGAPMTQLLLDLAAEARKEYRAQRQELVAKAPVKMLLPTGALILPAMLLLVMGPIILDLLRKMG